MVTHAGNDAALPLTAVVVVILTVFKYFIRLTQRALAIFRMNKPGKSLNGGLAITGFKSQQFPDHF